MIRPFAADDLGQVLEVWYQASLIAHSFLSEGFFEAERRLIAEQFLPASDTIVYQTDGCVVGFLSLVGDEVGGLFVAPGYQRRGIGRALLDRARESHSRMELDVFEANSDGRAFYEAYGFEFVDRHINDDVGEPELRLRYEWRA